MPGRSGGRGRARRGEDLVHPLKVNLEDLYRGKTSNLSLQKSVLCSDCHGKGCKNPESIRKCDSCHGAGVKISLRQIGPGMVQQLQQPCGECRGEGEIIREKDKCKRCKGQKILSEKKLLEVYIDKGMKHGQRITFTGEGDQAPDILPGDIIVVLQQREHPVFKRDGDALLIEHELTLFEALCGFTFTITHLDDRVLAVKHSGSVIKPDDIKCIPNEGMPGYKRPFEKGPLVIKFTINFPDSFTEQQMKELARVFPVPKGPALSGDEEEVTLADFDGSPANHGHSHGHHGHSHHSHSHTRRSEAYEEDDGEGGAEQPGVRCAQQ